MKERKNDNNPVVKKDELDAVRKDISKYFQEDYPDWLMDNLQDELKALIKKLIMTKPDWLIKIIKDTIRTELTNNLKIHLSGYSSIRAEISYDGSTITSANKYIPR